MNYSETIVPITTEEKKKQVVTFVVITLLPLVFTGLGFLLTKVDFFWAIFSWVGAAAVVLFVLIPKTIRLFKDDFYRHKIIYKGILQEVRTVKMGAGTASTMVYELVLEKAVLKIAENGFVKSELLEIALPEKGEEVEIHALPKSGDIIRLLVKRNNTWESLALL